MVRPAFAIGVLGVLVLIAFESTMALGIMRVSLADYLAGYDLTRGALFPVGLALMAFAPVIGRMGERVVIYLEHLGRVEGKISRQFQNGFAIQLLATRRKMDKLASALTWLANRHELGLPEDRRHERVLPRQTGAMWYRLKGSPSSWTCCAAKRAKGTVRSNRRPTSRPP